MSKQNWKKRKIKGIIFDMFTNAKIDSSDETVLRTLVFTHTPDTYEFWDTTVPEIIKQWTPEKTQEIENILNS